MLYREIIAVCSQIHTKHINTPCGQNVELLNVKLAIHIVTTRFGRDRGPAQKTNRWTVSKGGHQRGLRNLPTQNDIQAVYWHTRITVNGVLKDFLKNGDSQITESTLFHFVIKRPPPVCRSVPSHFNWTPRTAYPRD